MRCALAVLGLIALAACAGSVQVTTHPDPQADFSRYRTYAWADGAPARPELEEEIRAAVDRQLAARGLRPVAAGGSPDLRVSTYASVDEEKLVLPDQWGYDLGPVGLGSSRVSTVTIPMGTLLVDLVEAGAGKLVWRGEAKKALEGPVSGKQVEQVVRKLFAGYPSKS
jgi:hypothetical protein